MSHPATALAQERHVVLISVESAQGSVPREPGAWMLVFRADAIGTIGGGRLELDALQAARELLDRPAASFTRRYALGPSLGQCCGGVVWLRFEHVQAADIASLRERLREPSHPVALFGGGHVGSAIVRACAELPLQLTWIDSRDGVFPEGVPANVTCEHSEPVEGAVPQLAPGSLVLVMSFSHAQDLEIVAACLRRRRERNDIPFLGLIGSATKWATFRRRLEERGFTGEQLDGVTCPIGIRGIRGKQPAVIAASAVAQLLQYCAPTPTLPRKGRE